MMRLHAGWVAGLLAVIGLTSVVMVRAAADSAEQRLKDLGLRRQGSLFTLEQEAEVERKFKQAQPQLDEFLADVRQMNAIERDKTLAEIQIQRMNEDLIEVDSDIAILNIEWGNRPGRYPNNQVKEDYEAIKARLDLLQLHRIQVRKQVQSIQIQIPGPRVMQERRREIDRLRRVCLPVIPDLLKLIDSVDAKYAQLDADSRVRSALDELRLGSKDKTRVGPSPQYVDILKRLDELSKSAEMPARARLKEGAPPPKKIDPPKHDPGPAVPPAAVNVQLEEVAKLPISPDTIAFSPDSKRVAAITAGGKQDCIDLATGKLLFGWGVPRPATGKYGAVKSVVFAPDGNLITSHVDQTVRVWDKSEPEKVREFNPVPLGETFGDLRFSKQGEWVVGVGQTHIGVWDYKSGTRLSLHPMSATVKSLDVHPNGKLIVSVDKENVIKVWDALTGRTLASYDAPTKALARVRFSPDGLRVLCLSQSVAEFSLVNPSNGLTIQEFKGPKAKLVDAAFLPSGRRFRLVSVNGDNLLRVWNTSRKIIYSSKKAFDTDVRGLGISPDGRYAVVVLKADTIVYRVRN